MFSLLSSLLYYKYLFKDTKKLWIKNLLQNKFSCLIKYLYLTLAYCIIIYICFVTASFSAKSQTLQDSTIENNSFIENKISYGLFVPHHDYMRYLMTHVRALQLRYGIKSFGKYRWEREYLCPDYGFGTYFADLNNPSILGYVFSIYIYINSPFFRWKKASINYEFAAGISYITKPFNHETNYLNNTIGSKINNYFNMNFNFNINLSKHLDIITTFGLTHYSNGVVKEPDLGINIIDINTGLRYYPQTLNTVYYTKRSVFLPYNSISLMYAAGIKELSVLENKKYFISTISLTMGRRISYKRRIGIGLDFLYNEALYSNFNDSINTRFLDAYRQGIFLSHEFIIEKLVVSLQLGTYLYTKTKPLFFLYTRTGLKYHINKHIFLNVSLKAHLACADYIEWGIGYIFYYKKYD